MAEFAHNPHTRNELGEFARIALSLREDYAKAFKKWPGERCVAFPFQRAYWIALDEKPTPPHKWRIQWLDRYREDYLQPLRNYRLLHYGFGPADDGDTIIATFNRHVRLFARELAECDPRAAIELRLDAGELPKLLRDARKTASPRLTQPAAAAKSGVSADTWKSWEHERSKPTSENRQKVVEFLLSQSQAPSHYSTEG